TINFDESDGDGGTIIFAGDTDFGGEENYVEYGISGKTLVAESSGDDPVSFEDLSKYTSEAQEVKALKNVIAMYPDDYESTNEELIVYFKDNSEFDLKELTLYAFLSNPDHKAYAYTFKGFKGNSELYTYTTEDPLPLNDGEVATQEVYQIPLNFTGIDRLVISAPGFQGASFDNLVIGTAGSGGPTNTIPTVTTASASGITATTAILGGNVTDNGGAEVTARGIEYSTTEGFTEGAGTQLSADEAGTGEFTVEMTGLTAATTYYYRAYATNSEGTSYG